MTFGKIIIAVSLITISLMAALVVGAAIGALKYDDHPECQRAEPPVSTLSAAQQAILIRADQIAQHLGQNPPTAEQRAQRAQLRDVWQKRHLARQTVQPRALPPTPLDRYQASNGNYWNCNELVRHADEQYGALDWANRQNWMWIESERPHMTVTRDEVQQGYEACLVNRPTPPPPPQLTVANCIATFTNGVSYPCDRILEIFHRAYRQDRSQDASQDVANVVNRLADTKQKLPRVVDKSEATQAVNQCRPQP